MKIFFSERFKKRFEKLPKKIQSKFVERFDMFIKNPTAKTLKIHPLKGNFVGYRAFSVSGDYRVIYRIIDRDSIKLVDIGTHSQVYE
jgi:addiction module RelE/StbE family toxin